MGNVPKWGRERPGVLIIIVLTLYADVAAAVYAF